MLLAIGTAVASAVPHDAELGRLAADRPRHALLEPPGVALLHADRLARRQVTGLVSLTNKGDKPGVLALAVDGRATSRRLRRPPRRRA